MLRLIKNYDLQRNISILGSKINVLDYIQFCHLGVGGIAFNAVSQEFTISGIQGMQDMCVGFCNENFTLGNDWCADSRFEFGFPK